MLAAAAMNLMTPGVGQLGAISFTKALLDVIPRLIHEKTQFTITELHRELLLRATGLLQQPLYAALFESSYGGIVIRCLDRASSAMATGSQRSEDGLVLRVSLAGTPTSPQKDEFLEWLTTARPSAVSSLWIEQTIKCARSREMCGEYLTKQDSYDEISRENRTDLLAALQMLQEAIHPANTVGLAADEDIRRIQNKIEQLCERFNIAFESCMQDMTPGTLKTMQQVDSIHDAGYSDLVSMRLLCLDESVVSPRALADRISFSTPARAGERFRRGMLNGSSVLVEYWYYDMGIDTSASSSTASEWLHRVQRVASLHLQLKPAEFCTLPGQGYRRESLPQDRVGMVYALPQSLEGQMYITLLEAYRAAEYVPMEVRKNLASKIARAICNFHVIGWLHKGLRSDNILVFGTQTPDPRSYKWSDIDFVHPFLVGFDYSRPDLSETELAPDFSLEKNLYRHPDRWGRPIRFQKKHDIYALVSPAFSPVIDILRTYLRSLTFSFDQASTTLMTETVILGSF
jgi:hypothetical protein